MRSNRREANALKVEPVGTEAIRPLSFPRETDEQSLLIYGPAMLLKPSYEHARSLGRLRSLKR